MLSMKVALLSKSASVKLEELTTVANALSIQVSHDLQPLWGVDATVAAFSDPAQVPPGYWPIFVLDQLPPGEGGFHSTKHKQPYAEVAAGDSWSLAASHELVEMLVDPSGNRLVAGPALTVSGGQIVEDQNKQVEYLVEACDPCEAPDYSYVIEDVVVSDFFTPHFHDPVMSAGTRYSLTGAITKPRQILKGGYISWSDPETGDLMQIQYLGNGPQLVNLSQQQGDIGGLSLREYVNKAEARALSLDTLSTVPASHAVIKLRDQRRRARNSAAVARSRFYTR